MKEKGILRSLWQSSEPKPGDEGIFEPYDRFNRASYKVSKPLALGSGLALTAGLSLAAPVFFLSAVWAGSDKLQIEGSKWLRKRVRGEKPQGVKEIGIFP